VSTDETEVCTNSKYITPTNFTILEYRLNFIFQQVQDRQMYYNNMAIFWLGYDVGIHCDYDNIDDQQSRNDDKSGTVELWRKCR
jgi:hypothetical protein